MRIERIETLVCHARMRNWVFVKVWTDQPGLFGAVASDPTIWRTFGAIDPSAGPDLGQHAPAHQIT
ncbi:MAG: hypothetical protein ACTHOU_03595, partial [Aureliella sp.]